MRFIAIGLIAVAMGGIGNYFRASRLEERVKALEARPAYTFMITNTTGRFVTNIGPTYIEYK